MMQLGINFIFSWILFIALVLSRLQCSNARSLIGTPASVGSTSALDTINKNVSVHRNTTSVIDRDIQHRNKSVVIVEPKTQNIKRTVVAHIFRKKREPLVTLPFDFNTKHLPCDMDTPGIGKYVGSFPNHCIWVYNNKYVHEGFFRIYKTYQVEGFFFGQFFERLKRFELDPQIWDYGNMGNK